MSRKYSGKILPDEVAWQMAQLIWAGHSIRLIAATMDLSTATVRVWRQYLREDEPLRNCGCGKPWPHSGWCKHLEKIRVEKLFITKCGCGQPSCHRGTCKFRLDKNPIHRERLRAWALKQNRHRAMTRAASDSAPGRPL